MVLWHDAMKIAGAHELGDMIARSSPSLSGAISAWHAEVSIASWTCEADIAERHCNAAFASDRVIFDLGHEEYCVIVRVNYEVQAVRMTYIGPRSGAPWATPRVRKAGAKS